MMFSLYNKLKKSYLKNIPELHVLRNKLYPSFIFEKHPITIKDEIPVFTLHAVHPERFEEQLKYLYKNEYQTLIADEFYQYLTGSKPIPERAILLTFDDGWKNLHSIAFPLLKKYNMSAVCFLVSGLITNVNNSNVKTDKDERGPDSDILCSWEEIKEINKTGIIDFQSHSLYHTRIFTSSIIDDFFYPSYDRFAYNFNVPLYRINGSENISRETKLGTPIYKNTSKFAGMKRYFDDQNLRESCVEFVTMNGGIDFFNNSIWRKKLYENVNQFRAKYKETSFFETEDEYKENIYKDFYESKIMIEKNLPGKVVSHFCYPWWEGSELAVEISKKAGYFTNFWGILPDRTTNRCGDDPYKIPRILTDDFIFRLPGIGRKSLFNIYQEKFSLHYNRFFKKLLQQDKSIN